MFQRLSRKDQKKIRLHLRTLPILLIYSDSCLYHDYNSTVWSWFIHLCCEGFVISLCLATPTTSLRMGHLFRWVPQNSLHLQLITGGGGVGVVLTKPLTGEEAFEESGVISKKKKNMRMKWKMCKMVMRSDVLFGFEAVSRREELVRLGWTGEGWGMFLWKWGWCYLEEEAGDMDSGHMGLPWFHYRNGTTWILDNRSMPGNVPSVRA